MNKLDNANPGEKRGLIPVQPYRTGYMDGRRFTLFADKTKLSSPLTFRGEDLHKVMNTEKLKGVKKEMLPCVTLAAVFDGGHKYSDIQSFTSLCMYDVDKMASEGDARLLKQALEAHPYTYATWVTSSGRGVRWVMRYMLDDEDAALVEARGKRMPEEWDCTIVEEEVTDFDPLPAWVQWYLCKEDYTEIWNKGKEVIGEILGMFDEQAATCLDEATKDATRLSFIPYSPEACFHFDTFNRENSLTINFSDLHLDKRERKTNEQNNFINKKFNNMYLRENQEVTHTSTENQTCATENPVENPVDNRLLTKEELERAHENSRQFALRALNSNKTGCAFDCYRDGCRHNYLFFYAVQMYRFGATDQEIMHGMLQIDQTEPDGKRLPDYDLAKKIESALADEKKRNEARGCERNKLTVTAVTPSMASQKTDNDEVALDYVVQNYDIHRSALTGAVEICPLEEKVDNPLQCPYIQLDKSGNKISTLRGDIKRATGIKLPTSQLYELLEDGYYSGYQEYDIHKEYFRYAYKMYDAQYKEVKEEDYQPLHPTLPFYTQEGKQVTVPWSIEDNEIFRVFSCLRHSDEEYSAYSLWISTLWFVSTMATVGSPEERGTIMLLLNGEAGIGKTTFLRNLSPTSDWVTVRGMEEWVSSSSSTQKELFNDTISSLFLIVDEYKQTSKNQTSKVKRELTQTHFNKRLLYSNNNTTFAARATFCGTTNEPYFISSDKAEMRRVVTLDVESIDHRGRLEQINIDYEKLYAQALWLWNQGFKYWIDVDKLEQLPENEAQMVSYMLERGESHIHVEMEEELINKYFYPPMVSTTIDETTGEEIPLQRIHLSGTEIIKYICKEEGLSLGDLKVKNMNTKLRQLGYQEPKVKGKKAFYLYKKM